MKFLVFVKATADSEKGIFPPDADRMFAEMGKFNEKLVNAGVMQEADGLKPSSAGARVKFSGNAAPTVIDGPFAETKELVAGYWIWNVKSLEEAIEWAKQCPNPMPGEEGVLEIRPCYALEDLADLVPKEEFEREARLRKQVASQRKTKSLAKTRTKAKAKSKAVPARKKPAKQKRARAKAK